MRQMESKSVGIYSKWKGSIGLLKRGGSVVELGGWWVLIAYQSLQGRFW